MKIKDYLQDQIEITKQQMEEWPLDNPLKQPGFLAFRWERVMSALKPIIKKDSKVLELGCRTGLFTAIMQLQGFKNIYGIDICKEAIEIAHKNDIKNCIVGDMHNMLYEDNFFDIIVATEIIEHSYDLVKLFTELKRVLKNSGVIFTTLPIEGKPKDMKLAQNEGHVIFFPHPAIFVQLANENGFDCFMHDQNLYPPDENGRVWMQGCGFLLTPKQDKENK